MNEIEVFIISWHGQLTKAKAIRTALRKTVSAVTIIHSEHGEARRVASSMGVVQVNDDWFFGKKFAEVLRRRTQGPTLVIQADANCDDWVELVRHYDFALSNLPTGVWAPEVRHSSWLTPKVFLRETPHPDLIQVSQTDAIVFGFSQEVAEDLSNLSYEANNLGWGIEWAAICSAMSRAQLILRDTGILVRHPEGSGYNQIEAKGQQEEFLSQLPDAQQVILQLLRKHHILHKRGVKPFISFVAGIENFLAVLIKMVPVELKNQLKKTIG